MEKDNKLVPGMIFKSKHPNSPDFVLGSVSFKVEEIVPYLQANANNGWVNVDFLRAKDKEDGTKGRPYFKLNDFKPEPKKTPSAPEYPQSDLDPKDIPF